MSFWVVSANEEEGFTGEYATEAEAIMGGPGALELHTGDEYWVGEAVVGDIPVISPDGIIETLIDAAQDEYENADDWLANVTPNQEDELESVVNDAIQAWLKKHDLEPKWFEVDNINRYVVP